MRLLHNWLPLRAEEIFLEKNLQGESVSPPGELLIPLTDSTGKKKTIWKYHRRCSHEEMIRRKNTRWRGMTMIECKSHMLMQVSAPNRQNG